MIKRSYVYILSNKSNSVLYIGVTSDLIRRISNHKEGKGSIFTKRYKIHKLIYFEEFTGIIRAVAREKQLKNWHRSWKLNLVQKQNPELKDLFFLILGRDPETSSG